MPSMAPSWTPKIEWSIRETPKTEDFEEKAFFDFFVSFPYLFSDFSSPRLPLLLGVPGDGVAPASGKVVKAIHAAEQSTSPCVLRLESAAWRFGRSPEPSSQMLAGCPVAASWYRALIGA